MRTRSASLFCFSRACLSFSSSSSSALSAPAASSSSCHGGHASVAHVVHTLSNPYPPILHNEAQGRTWQ